jgi:hypothetical protein
MTSEHYLLHFNPSYRSTSYSTVSSKSDLTNSDHLCINIEINRGNHMYLGDFNIINILSGVVGFTTISAISAYHH